MTTEQVTGAPQTGAPGEPIVQVRDVKMYFPVTSGIIFQRKVADVKAVDGVTFDVKRGETLGLVGESGCGKTTLGRMVLLLYKPTAGQVLFNDHDLTKLKSGDLRRMRRHMQMIFQDPYASLNPRMTVGSIIGEPLVIHGLVKGRKERQERVRELMQVVGLNPYYANRYPARILRRPAAAHRHRAGARRPAGLHRLRRADLSAGRVDPGADHQPAGRPAAAVRPDLPLHRPRPLGRPSHQ